MTFRVRRDPPAESDFRPAGLGNFFKILFKLCIGIGVLVAIPYLGSNIGSIMEHQECAQQGGDYDKCLEEQAQRDEEYRAERAERRKAEEAEEARVEARLNAIHHCQSSITRQARFPSEVDFDWGINRTQRTDTFSLTGTVRLMNGLGNMIPHTYHCEIEDGSLLSATIDTP